jgi:hypothetical protein
MDGTVKEKPLSIKDVAKHFKIQLKPESTTSPEAVRQFVRVVEAVLDNKQIIKATSGMTGKITYHATAGDVARYLNSIGILNASTQNIIMGLRANNVAYGHTVERITIEKEIN